jgi:hypothetical protein
MLEIKPFPTTSAQKIGLLHSEKNIWHKMLLLNKNGLLISRMLRQLLWWGQLPAANIHLPLAFPRSNRIHGATIGTPCSVSGKS